jgi:hypothetical protein
MAIPGAQLETWAKQGATVGSAATYATIKRALESTSTKYTDRDFSVFLQGSYGNDTNVYAESDVDIVILYHGAYYRDLDQLDAAQKAAYLAAHTSSGTYSYDSFKQHVEDALRSSFGPDVKPGSKAINILANGSRRSADVIVAFDHRRYHRFVSGTDCSFSEGISFFTSSGSRTDNFPRQHSENATTKHQAAHSNFKPLVRIFKNMRGRLVDNGVIKKGEAPSYFIEGLLYNVPNTVFTGSYADMVYNVLLWLGKTTDHSKFECVNGFYYLIRDNSPVCWPTENEKKFLNALVRLWDDWSS